MAYPCMNGYCYPIMTALNVVSPHNLLWAYKGTLDVRYISNERVR